MKKKLVSMLLVAAMTASLCACTNNAGTPSSSDASSSQVEGSQTSTDASNPGEGDTTVSPSVAWADMDYDEASAYVYDAVLGEYYDIYQKAYDAKSDSESYALQALAEAKLLEAAIMLPTQSQGGNYAISRVAPYTVSPVLWGNDTERNHQIIVCNEIITSEDRETMKAKHAELKGTGTYEQWAKDFLTGKGYTIKDTYNVANNADPVTWDVISTSQAADSEKIVQTYDGLVEYDLEGVLQPALAESWEVSSDGLTYTFHLRNTVWVDSQGRKVADVVADDFVAGFQHMLDCPDAPWYLVQDVVVGATEYTEGEITDFSQVGIKAVDEHTVTYTLEQPTSYFLTMLGYGAFAPMSRAYYESQGGKFGADFDPSADTYKYGTTKDNIAYCGPYLVTNATEKNIIKFEANKNYWNKDNINIKVQNWLFNDGTDTLKSYNDMVAGTIDGAGLNSSALEIAKNDGNFDKYHYVSSCNATTYSMFLNVNRAAFANFNDETKAVSPQSEDDALRTKIAMNNLHFRRAICFSVDRASYNAQSVGEELKLTSLRNSYTPGNFVFLSEAVTVDINGKATTFKAGTNYGEILQAQLDADGVKIKAWDPKADGGAGSSDAFDGWYNVENAKAELSAAIEELKAEGVEVSAQNPIYLDITYFSGSTTYTNRANVIKQSIEAALDKNVIINLVECKEIVDWYYAAYYPSTGDQSNFDLNDLSGWGPDYGDPKTFLDTFLPEGAGYMVKNLGIY
ncbi:MAG: peptide ABC transporter substrate-binding protein [Acetatifactor sp.]|nr:peptide ABC transporter substrate-binding protein [Acetatifactor sp.]